MGSESVREDAEQVLEGETPRNALNQPRNRKSGE